MSLRLAKMNDYRKKSASREYPEKIDTFSVQNSAAIADFTGAIGKGIVALVGGNGAGKSTVAHAIINALDSSGNVVGSKRHEHRLFGSTFTFSLTKDGKLLNREVTFSEDGKVTTGIDSVRCQWIDPSFFATSCLQQIAGDASFEDVLDEAAHRVFDSSEVDLASYIVGKQYVSCEVWEISDYGPFDPWPYFRVSVGGVVYGSEAMGQGELALLSIMWAVTRCPINTLVVLEEPETHVSSRSQLALMDFFAKECAQRALSFILTTHSAAIVERLSPDNIFLFILDSAQVRIQQAPSFHHLAALLGGGTAHKSLLVVEDALARVFADTLLQVLAPDLARQATYSVCSDGESEIVKILRTTPRVKDWGHLIGCFDGDQRLKHESLVAGWPHIFLPGNIAPEKLLLEAIKIAAEEDLATNLGIDRMDVVIAYNAAAGSDHHDWFQKFSSVLGVDFEIVLRAVVRVWIDKNKSSALDFVEDLKKAISLR